MAEAIDYLSDEQGDLIIEKGDFKKGDCTLQHQKDLLLSQVGEYKQDPFIGVGISDFILDEKSIDELQHIIQSEFENDGMKIKRLKINSLDDIEIVAEYE